FLNEKSGDVDGVVKKAASVPGKVDDEAVDLAFLRFDDEFLHVLVARAPFTASTVERRKIDQANLHILSAHFSRFISEFSGGLLDVDLVAYDRHVESLIRFSLA